MAYTNIWDDTKPTGSEPANTIDDLMRSMKVDIEQRFNDMFAMPSFATDPLRLYGLKFTDAQDSVISLGDNSGPSRSLIIKDKAGANTYLTVNSVNIIASTLTLVKYANPEFRLAGSAINQNLNQTFYDNNATEKGHIIYAGANSVSNRYFGIFSDAADFLLVATLNNVPVQFWTNSTLALTIGTNQAVTLASSLTTTSVLASVNQNATTLISVSNTDVTNANSRAELRVVGGAISGIMSSIATDALYIGASTNSIVRFISNGAEKFRLDTSGIVTFQNAINILTGGLTVTAGDSLFAAGIKQTGTVATRIENTFITVPSGSTGAGLELGIGGAGAIGQIQSFNRTGIQFSPLLIQGSYIEIAQGPLLINTTNTTGSVAGWVVVPNNGSFAAINQAGTTAVALVTLSIGDRFTLNCNSKELAFTNIVTSTTASVGAGNTIPATCDGFFHIQIGGVTRKVAFFGV